MVSSLTSLERFVPLTLGIAMFNLIFLWGILTIATNHNVTMESPIDLQIKVATAGFDLAFLGSFVVGLIILALTFVIREEIHPDYKDGSGGSGPGMI